MYSKVLKEVVLQLYMCTLCEKAKNGCIYKFRKESIHCTWYLLIQVEIVSVCKLCVLAGLPKFSVDFFALGVWSLMDYLQCGCRCRCRCGYGSFCCRCRCRSFCCIFHNFCYLCIFHIFFLSFCKIQN